MKLRHVMIDLETMSTKQGAAIVSIGAVKFDPRFGKIDLKDTFYQELHWKSQNRHIDPSTEEWWSNQSKAAKSALKGTIALEDMLWDLEDWLPDDCRVWGNGSIFDISILENAYDQHNEAYPWKFWNVRDCRTIKDLYESLRGGFDGKVGGTAHNALDDAIHQAKYINYMWAKIGGK